MLRWCQRSSGTVLWSNATWGSDPGTQISGLATAGLTAALAGLAAAHKLLEKAPKEDEKQDKKDKNKQDEKTPDKEKPD